MWEFLFSADFLFFEKFLVSKFQLFLLFSAYFLTFFPEFMLFFACGHSHICVLFLCFDKNVQVQQMITGPNFARSCCGDVLAFHPQTLTSVGLMDETSLKKAIVALGGCNSKKV